jgi:glutaredoxin
MKRAATTGTLLLLAGAMLAAAAFAQQMYRWTDEKGRVHITDTPPPPSARDVQKKKAAAAPATGKSEQPSYDLALAMKDYPVVLYTSPLCKEPCASARDALNRRGVPFREVQVWDIPSNELLKRVSGSNQVPTLVVGSSVQMGYEQGAYDALLDSARYPKAGAVPPRTQAAPPVPEGYTPPDGGEPVKAQPVQQEPRPSGPYSPGAPPQRATPR